MVVSMVASGKASTWLTVLLQMLTGQRSLFDVECCVTVSWYMLFFWATKVMETESAVKNLCRSVIVVWPLRNVMFRGVRVFVLREPVVLEYSHDRHAKKNAPLHRLAMC